MTTSNRSETAQGGRRKATFAAILVASIALFIAWWSSSDERVAPPTLPEANDVIASTATPGAPSAPAGAPSPPRKLRAACQFKRDQKFAFDVRERLSWVVDAGHSPHAGADTTLGALQATLRDQGEADLRWRLDMQVVELVDGGGAIFAATVSRPQARVNDRVFGVGPERVTLPMLVRIGARCDVQSMARGQTTGLQAARVQQALLTRLSFRLPPDDDTPSYEEVERDEAGVNQVQYTTISKPLPTVKRTVTACESLNMFDSRRGSVTCSWRGQTSITPGAAGWFKHQAVDEERTFIDMEPYAVIRRKMTATSIEAQPVPTNESTVDGWIWGDLLTLRAAELEVIDEATTGLAGMPVKVLKRMLFQLRANEILNPMTRVDLARDWMRANPKSIGAVIEQLRADVDDAHLYMLGLRLTNNEENLRVLRGVAVDVSMTMPVRAAALVALAASPLFAEEHVDMLRQLAVSRAKPDSIDGKVAAAALAALGIAGRLHRGSHPIVAERARNILHDEFVNAASKPRLLATLCGLANLGDDTTAELLLPRRNTEDSDVRAAVARATTRMHPSSAEAVWGEVAASEKSPEVRLAMAEATAHHIATFADDPHALRLIAGPTLMHLGFALKNGHKWARAALQQRLHAETRAEQPNQSVVAEVDALLRRFASKTP